MPRMDRCYLHFKCAAEDWLIYTPVISVWRYFIYLWLGEKKKHNNQPRFYLSFHSINFNTSKFITVTLTQMCYVYVVSTCLTSKQPWQLARLHNPFWVTVVVFRNLSKPKCIFFFCLPQCIINPTNPPRRLRCPITPKWYCPILFTLNTQGAEQIF